VGMYDSIMVACPKCATTTEFQSKSGACTLNTYVLDDVPLNVLRGALGDVERCPKCDNAFSINETDVNVEATGAVVISKKAHLHVMEALRDAARLSCRRSNCGTVCLCMRCHARAALEELDPGWRP
jgi:phage FluMu protein Com